MTLTSFGVSEWYVAHELEMLEDHKSVFLCSNRTSSWEIV